MRSVYIDPDTADYALEDGRFQITEEVDTEVYLCLLTWRGTRIGDETFGSRLHELQDEGSPARAADRAPALVTEALQPLVEAGTVTSIDTVVEALDDGVALNITLEGPGYQPATFRVFQKVGP